MKKISIIALSTIVAIACSKENIEQVNTEFSHQLAQLAIAASNYNLTPLTGTEKNIFSILI